MNHLPWMKWHWSFHREATRLLNCTQYGAYIRIIDYIWHTGAPPPDEDRALANIVGIRIDSWKESVRPALAPLFGPGWRHPHTEELLEEARQHREQKRIAGLEAQRQRKLAALQIPTVHGPRRSNGPAARAPVTISAGSSDIGSAYLRDANERKYGPRLTASSTA